MYKKQIALFALVSVINVHGKNGKFKIQNPPHCTVLSKQDTNYNAKFKYSYPTSYIIPGQREVYQELYCVDPPSVSKAWTTVCDWTAAPQVQFTIGYDYLHVERYDPSGQYLGKAIINTHQMCSHNITRTNGETNVDIARQFKK